MAVTKFQRKVGLAVVTAAVVWGAAADDGVAKTKHGSIPKSVVSPVVTPAPAVATDPLGMAKAAAEAAAKANDVAGVQKANADITALVSVLPPWVDEKQQAASVVPQDKQKIVGIWNKLHAQAIEADAAGNQEKALDSGGRAATIAKDNLGETHFATIISLSDLAGLQSKYGKIEEAETTFVKAAKAAEAALGTAHPETLKVKNALTGFYVQQIRLSDALAMVP